MPCPICSRPEVPAYRPFCSRRCADVDLARWLNGSYALPSEEARDGDGNGDGDGDGDGTADGDDPDRSPQRDPPRPH